MRESFGNPDSLYSRDASHLRPVDPSGNFSANSLTSPGKSTDFVLSQLRKRVLDWLSKNVPDARLQHILRVEEMSVKLACHYRLDENKAAQAGLMHDLAKFFKPKRLLEIAQAEGLKLDSVTQANPHLLHAEVGAIVARDEFGVCDETVLQAIRNHTLGSPGMDSLNCVVFLADSLEPGRGKTLELEHLRQICWQNLYWAVWLTCDYSLRDLLSTHRSVHPRMVLTRNWAMEKAQKWKLEMKG